MNYKGGNMRGIKFVMVLTAICFLLVSSCSAINTKMNIRFYNATNAAFFWQYGGIKFSNAYSIGRLPAGSVTSYFEANSGSYSVEMQNNLGQWVPATINKLNSQSGITYTLWITSNRILDIDASGNITDSTWNQGAQFNFQLVQD
jgi:hypothetical protein